MTSQFCFLVVLFSLTILASGAIAVAAVVVGVVVVVVVQHPKFLCFLPQGFITEDILFFRLHHPHTLFPHLQDCL